MQYMPKSGFGIAAHIACEECGASITVPEGEQVRCEFHREGKVENPNTWGPFEWLIDNAIRKYETATKAGIVGKSLVKTIADDVDEAIRAGKFYYINRI
jgi:hypothetical protein